MKAINEMFSKLYNRLVNFSMKTNVQNLFTNFLISLLLMYRYSDSS